jgi:hypothetical protein
MSRSSLILWSSMRLWRGFGRRNRRGRGASFSNELWRTVELFWLEDRNARPGVEETLSSLSDAVAFWYMRDF